MGGNLLAAIEAKRKPDPARFLFGRIRHVGAVTARDLVKAFGTVEHVADVATRAADDPEARGELEASTASAGRREALIDFFAEEHNRVAWDDLLSQVQPVSVRQRTARLAVSGQTLVFTGSRRR